jgi:type II restriction enzyme
MFCLRNLYDCKIEEMNKISREKRIERLVNYLPDLSEGQIIWLERLAYQFTRPKNFSRNPDSNLVLTDLILDDFGDALRIHHCFTDEPFTKDKFEYVLVSVFKYYGIEAEKSAYNNPGADVSINNETFSLKTQADKNLRLGSINIHKYMELGKGEWSDQLHHLSGLKDQFLKHLSNYDRVLVLRNIGKPMIANPYWKYELVEIPKSLFMEVSNGEYKMTIDSIQMPKPGYCRVRDNQTNNLKFELYFDGGTERKLKINKIDKRLCEVHATWEFIIKELEEQNQNENISS